MMIWTRSGQPEEEEISAIDGIGPVIAKSLDEIFQQIRKITGKLDHLLGISSY